MFTELAYLAVGMGKKMDKIIASVMEEGRKELENKGITEIAREHLDRRKEMVKGVVFKDVKRIADELGLATKEDIEELKKLLQNSQNR